MKIVLLIVVLFMSVCEIGAADEAANKPRYTDESWMDEQVYNRVLCHMHQDIAENNLNNMIKQGFPKKELAKALARVAQRKKHAKLRTSDCQICNGAIYFLGVVATDEELENLIDIAMTSTVGYLVSQAILTYHSRKRRTKEFFDFADKVLAKKSDDTDGMSTVWWCLSKDCEEEASNLQEFRNETVAFCHKHLLDENVQVVSIDKLLMRYDSSYPKSELRVKALGLIKKFADKLPKSTVKRYEEAMRDEKL